MVSTRQVLTPSPATTAPDMTRGLIGASIAVTAWGASGIIAKWLPMGGLAVAAYRFALYFLIITAWRTSRGHRLSWDAFVKSLPAGLLLALDVALFFSAVKNTSIVNATIIGSLQPLLLTMYGAKYLGERLQRRDIMLGAAALVGVIAIVSFGSNGGEANLSGDLLAVGALFAWSGYFALAKRADGVVSPVDLTLSASLIVVIVNAPLALVFGQSLAWPDLESWFWLLVMALGAGILGHNMMNWSIVRLPLWLSGTLTLFVPVISSALAWIILDESLDALQIAGMALAVAALGSLVTMQSRSQRT